MKLFRKRASAASEDKTGRQKRHWGWSLIAFLTLGAACIVVAGYAAVDKTARENPSFCAMCHNMKSHVDSYVKGNTLDNVHKQAGVGCKDCHANYGIQGELASVVKYVTGDYEQTFSRRKFDDSMCLKCHISRESLANQTDYLVKNPHLSHYPDLRCGTCHVSHDKQVDYCSRCHDNGGQRMTGGTIVPRAQNPWANPNAERPTVQ